MSDEVYMRLAIQKAWEGIEEGQTPFGACLVREGAVVSCAHNRVWSLGDITAHAEVQAIRDACTKLRTVNLAGCTLYSTCEPCPMCFSACHWARIARIVYGARIEDARRLGFHELGIPAQLMKELGQSEVALRGDYLREECLRLLSAWSERSDNRAY